MNIEEISNSYEIMNNALFKKKYNNDNQQGRLDPRARRLQSYGDVDEFAEDDLVYTR